MVPYAPSMSRLALKMQELPLDPRIATLGPIPDRAVQHGEVFTRDWVVGLILDLAGYDAERDLATLTAVEPACGTGAFLGPMTGRLSRSCRSHGRPLADAADALRAFDLLPRNVEASRRVVETVLIDDGWSVDDATAAAVVWVQRGDYLLDGRDGSDVRTCRSIG